MLGGVVRTVIGTWRVAHHRARHCNRLMAAHWAAPNGLPQIPGRMMHPAMMRRPDRQLVAWSARCGKHIVDVHFPIRHDDHRDARRNGLLGGCLRRQPALALLVRRFPLPPPMPVASRSGVADPHCLMDQAQRHPVAAHRER